MRLAKTGLGRLAIILALCAAGQMACNRREPESRVKSVTARIDGLTCATCVPPLTAALKRQYSKSAVAVDDEKDTATVNFADGEDFSAADFRASVERVRMRVVSVRLQACGQVEAAGTDRWLTAGRQKFLVRSEREMPLKAPLCADGTLDSASDPAVFHVSAFSVQSASGS